MKGDRGKYNDFRPEENHFEFFRRHTSLERYQPYSSAYNHLTDFLNEKEYEVSDMGDDEAEEFCRWMKSRASEQDTSVFGEESAEKYVKKLARLFDWMASNTNYADWEPFTDAINTVGFDYDEREPKKREVPLDDLRQHLRNTSERTVLVALMVMLKCGLRVGELTSLYLRDITLDHPISDVMPDPRPELTGLRDNLYVDSSRDGCKPNSYREVPIDNELKSVLAWYIAHRPVGTGHLIWNEKERKAAVEGLSTNRIENSITEWSKKHGLFIEPRHDRNIHAHWCRHWFSTYLRAAIDDDDVLMGTAKDYVQGLRGDSEESVIETYSHEWDSLRGEDDLEYREIYEEAMPRLLIKPQSTDVPKDEPVDRLKQDFSGVFDGIFDPE